MTGHPAPPPVTLKHAVADLQWHAHALAEWLGNERQSLLQMRKFVRLYLHGFCSAAGLQRMLMHADSLRKLDKVVSSCHWDPHEPFAESSAVYQRLKGGEKGAVQRVVLPDGWMDDDYDLSLITDVACEG
jgi:hypothetical protein